MGNSKWLAANRQGKEYETVGIIDGVEVVKKVGANVGSTPRFSNSSTIYLTCKNNRVSQIACYDPETHVKIFDIDWNHDHGKFKKGEPHVHYYEKDRNRDPVEPTKDQLELYEKFANREVRSDD